MSDIRQPLPPPVQTPPRSNNAIVFIVGGLVVAVGVLAFVFTRDDIPGSGTPAVSIENNTTTPAPVAPGAPADPAPAAPAPAAPAPGDPAPAAPAPATPAPVAPANP